MTDFGSKTIETYLDLVHRRTIPSGSIDLFQILELIRFLTTKTENSTFEDDLAARVVQSLQSVKLSSPAIFLASIYMTKFNFPEQDMDES